MSVQIGLLNFAFNSPWECRIGLTPACLEEIRERGYYFQFPVGMSNRSYTKAVGAILKEMEIPFNSPWECRIGLTDTQISRNEVRLDYLSIPRGNVE